MVASTALVFLVGRGEALREAPSRATGASDGRVHEVPRDAHDPILAHHNLGAMNDDVLSRRRLHARDLRGITFAPRPLALLALWLFLARHAAPCAQVVVLHPKDPRT